jgi:predicted dehydrogenase
LPDAGPAGYRIGKSEGRLRFCCVLSADASIEIENAFALELDHFARSVLDGKPVRTPGADGLADLRVIAAIEEAARTGRAVRIG